ncbi:hypothetical protein RS9916_37717 [Synechococcus sp. RS9916]|nr:hypothetical protein RS9916_37717 [Synechococcus sp. RS9916]
MAIRAWMDGDLRLAMRLLQWAQPELNTTPPGPAHQRTHDNDGRAGDWSFQAA